MEKKSLKKTDDKKRRDATQLEKYRQQEEAKEMFFSTWSKPKPMVSLTGDINKMEKIILGLSRALAKENSQDSIVDRIVGEVIARAYQDAIVVYGVTLTENALERIQRIQRIRQSADLHLVRIIQAFMDMKRPSVSVVVKRTGQVNVADKQINISQAKDSPSDLDKKNEEID